MSKCKHRRRHQLLFQQPGENQDAYLSGANDWEHPAQEIRRWGYLSPRIPTEVIQAGQMHGALGYDIQVPFDPAAAAITAEWRVVVETMGGKILTLRGPAANRGGNNTRLDFVGVEETT